MTDLKKTWEKSLVGRTWRKRKTPLPGTIDDFVKFLGAESQEEVEAMNFTQMEKLPGVVGNNLINSRGHFRQGLENFHWTWETTEKGPNHASGEAFYGRGQTYDEAALRGLVVYWELTTYRKKQKVPL